MRRFVFVALLALAAPVAAVIDFPPAGSMCLTCSPITASGSYSGSKVSYNGGVILHVAGVPDGATVALEVNAGGGWIPSDTCAAITTAQVCRAAPGPVSLRVTITGAGASTALRIRGFEAQAVVASAAGAGGAASWDDLLGGTSTEDFLVGDGGSFGPTGSGTVTATAVPWTGVANPPILTASPDYSIEPPAANGALIVRQPGGVAGTDDVRVYHDGTNSVIEGKSGDLRLLTAGTSAPLVISQSGGNAILQTLNSTQFRLFRSEIYPDQGGFAVAYYSGDAVNLWAWAGGAERWRITGTYLQAFGCKNFGKLTAAPTGAACDRYYDTDLQTWCSHNGTDWLDEYTGLVTCS